MIRNKNIKGILGETGLEEEINIWRGTEESRESCLLGARNFEECTR